MKGARNFTLHGEHNDVGLSNRTCCTPAVRCAVTAQTRHKYVSWRPQQPKARAAACGCCGVFGMKQNSRDRRGKSKLQHKCTTGPAADAADQTKSTTSRGWTGIRLPYLHLLTRYSTVLGHGHGEMLNAEQQRGRCSRTVSHSLFFSAGGVLTSLRVLTVPVFPRCI
jgi:hypothetical protein